MGIAKYNKTSKFNYKMEGEPNFVSLAELFGIIGEKGVAKLLMFYKNTKGKFGDAYVAIAEYKGAVYNVNLPKHMNHTMEEIYNDDESVDAINEGTAGIKVYTYHSNTYNKDCFGCEFADIEQTDNGEFMECDADALPFE